jgi:hypothetical protein
VKAVRYLPPIEEPKELKGMEYKFDICRSEKKGWSELCWRAGMIVPFTNYLKAHSVLGPLDKHPCRLRNLTPKKSTLSLCSNFYGVCLLFFSNVKVDILLPTINTR